MTKCICENKKERCYIGFPGAIWASCNVPLPWKRIERCDTCQLYSSDEQAALIYAFKKKKLLKVIQHSETDGWMIITR